MNAPDNRTTFSFSPRTREEAAAFMRACAARASQGDAVRVRLMEGSFREGAYPIFGPGGIQPGSAAPIAGIDDMAPGSPTPIAGIDAIPCDAGSFTVEVSCRAIDRIDEISDSDMLAVVGSGVTLCRLQRAAREKGLYFPFEPESPRGDPALAELIQDGAISRYEGRYGRLRESILSIEGVTGAGETFHTGSRSVKDVTGYELAGLLTGSGGRLAMITSVTLRLIRLPGTMVSFAVGGEPGALRVLAGEFWKKLSPASLELFGGMEARSLLVIAAHDSGAGREKEIEASIREMIGGRPFTLSACRPIGPGAETAGPGVDGGDGENPEAARRETLVPGEIHIAADIRSGAVGTEPRRASRESFFPHRAHWRLSKDDFEPGGYFSDPRSRERFVAALAPGFRIRAEEIIASAGGPAARRIWPSIEGGHVAVFLAGLENAGVLEGIRERLRDVFDPERILSD